MGNLTRTCLCGSEINDWRSCPLKGCDEEAVVCIKCGGDAKAMIKMQQHIYTAHTDYIVPHKALVAFRARLLMKHYRDAPEGMDVGYLTGYFVCRDPNEPVIRVVLGGELIPGVHIQQVFRWFRVADGSIWEGYYTLMADEPKDNAELVNLTELRL